VEGGGGVNERVLNNSNPKGKYSLVRVNISSRWEEEKACAKAVYRL